MTPARLIPLPDGPYEVTGAHELVDPDGEAIKPPGREGLPLPLQALGEEAVLRRLARPHRMDGEGRVSGVTHLRYRVTA